MYLFLRWLFFMRVRRFRDRMVVGFKLPVQSVPITTNVVRSGPTQARSGLSNREYKKMGGRKMLFVS